VTTVGLIHPGAMGASVGAAGTHNQHRVLWAGAGRSDETRERANRGKLEDCDSVANLVSESDVILSVCPPHAAEDVASEVIDCGFKGIFVEGNAIAPARSHGIADRITAAGARFVDGGIIGGPAWQAEAGTMFYLSGVDAPEIAALFDGSPLHASVVSDQIGSASALKMVFAAYTKGSTALLTTILAVAEKEGVRANLEQQWGETFTEKTHKQVAGNTAKAWRFAGEMEEIAATFAGAGFSDGFHLAASDIFSRLKDFKDTPATSIDQVLDKLS
jgi:3-hydroxyisobutyrate dehydrogenase-like beta-hydroxyacid dehydrogenase